MPHYRLTEAAEADFRDIFRYTTQHWGTAQAHKYRGLLVAGVEHIASGAARSKDLSHWHKGMRMMRCEHHYIVCLHREDDVPTIIAVFHEKMDLMARLAKRLRGVGG